MRFQTLFSLSLLPMLAVSAGAQTPNAQTPNAQTPNAQTPNASTQSPLSLSGEPGNLERLLAARPVVGGTLSLEDAVSTALRESPVVRGAAEEVEAALGQLNAARAERRPMLSANTFLSGGSLPNIVESPQLPISRMIMGLPRDAYFDQNLMLMMPLYTGGRLKTMVRQAQAARETSQAELEGQRQEIALLTRTAYREVQARRALVEVQQARLRENEEQLRLDRIRAEEGKIPPFFVLRQEAEVAATQQELTNARRDVELSLLQLKTVMGVHPASDFSVPGALEYQPSADFLARLSRATSTTGGSALNVTNSNATSSNATSSNATSSNATSSNATAPNSNAANSSASSPQVPAPASGSTASGVAVPGSEVPGLQTPPSSAAPASVTAPGASTPDTGSTAPPASTTVPSASTTGASTPDATASMSQAGATGISANLSTLLRVAERGRPELRAARLRITGAELETAAIAAAYRPQVNAFVMGDVGQSGGFGSSRSSSRFGGITFGVAASIPLYTGGRRSAATQTAEAARRRLERERERVALEVAQGVNAAYLNMGAAEQNILTAQAALRSAQEDYRLARIRYEAGRSIIVEVLDALATRVRAESNVVQALFGYNVARDQLLRAVGVLDVGVLDVAALDVAAPQASDSTVLP